MVGFVCLRAGGRRLVGVDLNLRTCRVLMEDGCVRQRARSLRFVVAQFIPMKIGSREAKNYPRPISQTARTTTAATASPSTPNATFQPREPSRCLWANAAGIHNAMITGGSARYIERGRSLIAQRVASRIVEIPAMISWFLRACNRVNSGATNFLMGDGRRASEPTRRTIRP